MEGRLIAISVFEITFEMHCLSRCLSCILSPFWIGIDIYLYRAVISGKPFSHIHLHPGYASLGQGPQPNLSRSIQWELVYYFYVRNYEDRAVTTTPAQITKIYLGVNNIDCTFV